MCSREVTRGYTAALAAFVTGWPGLSRATVGGPLTVEVLGWDPSSERVYARQAGHDESGGERDCVFYFDLRAADPARAQVVKRSLERWSPDSSEMARFARERARLQRFLSRLRPLALDEGRQGPFLRDVRIVDDRQARYSPVWDPERRFIVDAGDSILVTTWREPRVRELRRYRLPGRDVRLVVLSFMGDPWGGGYEVQRCALAGPADTRAQHLASSDAVLPVPR